MRKNYKASLAGLNASFKSKRCPSLFWSTFEQLFRGIRDYFRESGVIVWHSHEVVHRALEVHHGNEFVNQLSGFGSDDVGA